MNYHRNIPKEYYHRNVIEEIRTVFSGVWAAPVYRLHPDFDNLTQNKPKKMQTTNNKLIFLV